MYKEDIIHIYIYVHTYKYMYSLSRTHIQIYTYMYIYIYMYIHTCTCPELSVLQLWVDLYFFDHRLTLVCVQKEYLLFGIHPILCVGGIQTERNTAAQAHPT